MKAVIWQAYGSPTTLSYEEVPRPEPKENEVLIKIYATTVTLGDCEIRGSYLPMWTRIPLRLYIGWNKPKRIKILGQECAGEIVKIGNNVKQFKVGDRVVAITGIGMGGYAQYVTKRVNSSTAMISKIPENVSYENATTLPVGGLNALFFINKANLKKGDHILINGAGGSIGTYAVMLSKMKGAIITVVDLSEKFDMLQKLGADHCIDFTKEDFTKSDNTYDVIFDIVGKASLRRSKTKLKSGGIYLNANPKPNTMIRTSIMSKLSDKTFYAGVMSDNVNDLELLLEMIAEEKITPVIDRKFGLNDIVEAHRYVETGQKKGHLVIIVDH